MSELGRELVQVKLKRQSAGESRRGENEIEVVVEEEDVFLVVQQGKSKFQTIFPYSRLKQSNFNLFDFEDLRKEEMVLPEKDELEGLRGKIVIAQLREEENKK